MKAKELAELLLQNPDDIVEIEYEDRHENRDSYELSGGEFDPLNPDEEGILRYQLNEKWYISLNHKGY